MLFFQADLSGNFTMVSPSALRMYGCDSLEEMIGMPASNLYANTAIRDQLIAELRSKGEITDFVGEGKRKDGSTFWVSMNIRLMYQNGKVSGTEGIVRDITERKQTEEKIRESEIRFREVLENSIDASYKRNLISDTYDYLSPVFSKLVGYTQEEMNNFPTETIIGMMHPDDIPEVNRVLTNSISNNSGNTYQLEYRFKHKEDGNYRWLFDKFTVIRDTQGKSIARIGSVSDITESKLAEEKIKESEFKYKYIFDNALEGMYRTSMDGKALMANDSLVNMLEFGSVDEYLKDMNDSAHQVWYNANERAEYIALLKKQEIINGYECQLKRKDGTPIWVLLNAKLVRDENGNALYSDGFITNITQRKIAEKEIIRAKEKAEESEIRFKAISEQAMDSIALTDLSGNYVFVNSSFCKMVGYSNQELLNMNVIDLRVSTEKPRHFAKLKENGIYSDSTVKLLRKDKSIIFVELNAQVLEINNEKLALGIMRDLTQRVKDEIALLQAKEKIEESEYRLKLATASGKLGIWDWNLIENTMIWDDRMFELYGINRDTFPNNIDAWTNGLHPEDKQMALDECNSALKGESEFNTTFRVLHPDGTVLYLKANGSVIRDENGKPLRMIGINSDITDLKSAEKALLESEKRVQKKLNNLLSPESDISELALEDIIDTDAIQSMMEDFFKFTKIPVAIIDLEGKVLVGPGWQDVCTKFHRVHPETHANCIECDTILTRGVPQGTFKSYLCKNNLWDNATPLIIGGRHIGNLFTGQFFYEGEKPDDEIFRAQAAQYGFDEKEYMDAVSRVPVYSREIIHDALGFFVTLANMISNLSHANIGLAKVLEHHKQTEVELIKAKDKAEESDRLKSAFLANMSHEIRTPLNSIIGFSDLLYDPDFEPEQKAGFTKAIIENGNNLLVIISDIIDLSMLEARQIKIRKEQFLIKKLITDLENEFRAKVNKKGLDFLVNVPSDQAHMIIENDYYRIRQIFNNLTSNALKFTHDGFIEIGFVPIEKGIEFFVKDTGIGIAPEFHEDIFETLSPG